MALPRRRSSDPRGLIDVPMAFFENLTLNELTVPNLVTREYSRVLKILAAPLHLKYLRFFEGK